MTEAELLTRSRNVIPNGVQTLSKMPEKHTQAYPKFLRRGEGCHVFDNEGRKFIDYPCGLGAMLLGYNHPAVRGLVMQAIDDGNLFSLPHRAETYLAERIIEMIPSAEMVRFLKTGSEATSAAIKIARAATGRKNVVACGYHGWHDWYCGSTPKNKGTIGVSYIKQAKFNSMGSFRKLVNDKTAAVIMEPYVYEEPKSGFLQGVKDLCEKNGAILIFDEVVTGFRTRGFSAQAFYGVTPDMTCLGKAMANGYPMAAVCGKRGLMKELEGDCFVSSTYGGDLIGIYAALATLDVVKTQFVGDTIWKQGEYFNSSFRGLAEATGVQAEIIGLPPRTLFKFETPTHKSLFWQECVKQGVLFGFAQFIGLCHNRTVVDQTMVAVRRALEMVKVYESEPEKLLEGPPATETLRLIQGGAHAPSTNDATDGRVDTPDKE